MDQWASKLALEWNLGNPRAAEAFEKLSGLYTLKTLPFAALLFAFWLTGSKDRLVRRNVVSGFAGTFLALLATRLIQNFGPHRPRPAYSGQFDFAPLTKLTPDWSSFPSDTLAIVAAMSTAIFLISRPLGVAAFAFSILWVGLAKLVTGAHYASDLIAGGLIGVAATLLFARQAKLMDRVVDLLERIRTTVPVAFYAGAFVVAFQLGTFFDEPRRIAGGTLKAAGIVKEEPLILSLSGPNRVIASSQ